jgi:hypothetical protein
VKRLSPKPARATLAEARRSDFKSGGLRSTTEAARVSRQPFRLLLPAVPLLADVIEHRCSIEDFFGYFPSRYRIPKV